MAAKNAVRPISNELIPFANACRAAISAESVADADKALPLLEDIIAFASAPSTPAPVTALSTEALVSSKVLPEEIACFATTLLAAVAPILVASSCNTPVSRADCVAAAPISSGVALFATKA